MTVVKQINTKRHESLVSFYINSFVLKLKEAEAEVKYRKQLISVLLYVDDAVILAADEKLMRQD